MKTGETPPFPVSILTGQAHCIENQFKRFELYYGNRKADNYSFIDSKDNPLTQVSDCIVGLLGKYYTYINRISRQEAYEMFNVITLA